MKTAIIANIPSPYQTPIFQRLAAKLGYDSFHVVFCMGKEEDFHWLTEEQGFAYTFLAEFNLKVDHNSLKKADIITLLRQLSPDVIVTTGFTPAHLYAFGYAYFAKKAHIPMTDGSMFSERQLSIFHRFIRKIVYSYSHAFVGASHGSSRLYADYGVNQNQFYQSPLCVENDVFTQHESELRTFDFMFSGDFVEEQNPLFALLVAAGVARILGRKVSILLVGTGPLMGQARTYAFGIADSVETSFCRIAQPEDYCKAKIFLFPTSGDVWGILANQACAAGQAVLVTAFAGVAGELVIEYEKWIYIAAVLTYMDQSRCAGLLSDTGLLQRFSENSKSRVQNYTFDQATLGLVNAIESAAKKPSKNKSLRKTLLESQNLTHSVVIIQRRMTDYRVLLFERLREYLRNDGIELRLLYGPPAPSEKKKKDASDLIWGEKLPTRYFMDERICWQPFYSRVTGSDLVVITQENKLISNIGPLFGYRPYRLAFWGHGANTHIAQRSSWFEKFKRITTKRVDWWFTYTELSKKLVADQGFPSEKITNLENSIDTTELKTLCEDITPDEIKQLKQKLNLGDGPIGLYIGSLYYEKRLDFLIDAAKQLVQRLPDFRLIVVGDGPLRKMIETAASQYHWLSFVGRQNGRAKARFLKVSNVLLNPGVIGLSILDAFVAGAPVVTTDCDGHGPEIDYLHAGENGFITSSNLDEYVQTVERILTDSDLANHLREGCVKSAQHYSIENMAQRFQGGILQALGLKKESHSA